MDFCFRNLEIKLEDATATMAFPIGTLTPHCGGVTLWTQQTRVKKKTEKSIRLAWQRACRTSKPSDAECQECLSDQ